MHQLKTSNSNTTKRTKKTLKRNKTQVDTSINVNDSGEDTPFRYNNITFDHNKGSVLQILQRSTLSNSDIEDENEEEKEENKLRAIETKHNRATINDGERESNNVLED